MIKVALKGRFVENLDKWVHLLNKCPQQEFTLADRWKNESLLTLVTIEGEQKFLCLCLGLFLQGEFQIFNLRDNVRPNRRGQPHVMDQQETNFVVHGGPEARVEIPRSTIVEYKPALSVVSD